MTGRFFMALDPSANAGPIPKPDELETGVPFKAAFGGRELWFVPIERKAAHARVAVALIPVDSFTSIELAAEFAQSLDAGFALMGVLADKIAEAVGPAERLEIKP